MSSDLIGSTWDHLEGRQLDLMHAFYKRLFERYPNYQALFPPEMDRHMPRMVRTFAMMSRLGEHPDVTENHLYHVGQQHQPYDLSIGDMSNFKNTFLEVLSEFCADSWTKECATAWNDVFDQRLLPQVMHGLSSPKAEQSAPSGEPGKEAPAYWYKY